MAPLKILFCSPLPLKKELGAPKIMMEVGEALKKRGCDVTFVDAEKIGLSGRYQEREIYVVALKEFLLKNANQFDVIEYEHWALPFSREIFDPHPLFVSRVSLLSLHFDKIKIPSKEPLWKYPLTLWRRLKQNKGQKSCVQMAIQTMKEADLISVANPMDTKEISSRGIERSKIFEIPYGANSKRFEMLSSLTQSESNSYQVVMIGSFDNRKGKVDLPKIVRLSREKEPRLKFHFLGTSVDKEKVLSEFDEKDQSSIEVISTYDSDSLVSYLKDKSIGIFPSYIESFGFGVLEMMMSGLPVIAYQAPGPTVMLPEEMFVESGDHLGMAVKILELARHPEKRLVIGSQMRLRAKSFQWDLISEKTEIRYREELKKKLNEPI